MRKAAWARQPLPALPNLPYWLLVKGLGWTTTTTTSITSTTATNTITTNNNNNNNNNKEKLQEEEAAWVSRDPTTAVYQRRSNIDQEGRFTGGKSCSSGALKEGAAEV